MAAKAVVNGAPRFAVSSQVLGALLSSVSAMREDQRAGRVQG